MPYTRKNDLPDNIQNILPTHAEDIYKSAFNNALKEYQGDESRAHAVAWAAVKHKYTKNDRTGKWEPKKSH